LFRRWGKILGLIKDLIQPTRNIDVQPSHVARLEVYDDHGLLLEDDEVIIFDEEDIDQIFEAWADGINLDHPRSDVNWKKEGF